MRLFFAVWPPPEVLQVLTDLQSTLMQSGADVRWSARQNLHFTLRFLGEIPHSGLDGLRQAALSAAGAVTSFELALSGVGSFPEKGDPRIVWAGAGDGRSELNELAGALERNLIACGFGPSDKPFRPHLTLGRVNSPRGASALRNAMAQCSKLGIGPWPVHSFALVESVLEHRGASYTSLFEFPLVSGSAQS